MLPFHVTVAGYDPELRGQAQEDNGEAIDRPVQATELQEGDSHVCNSAVDAKSLVDIERQLVR